jgi:hypothetical protein
MYSRDIMAVAVMLAMSLQKALWFSSALLVHRAAAAAAVQVSVVKSYSGGLSL